MNNFYLKIITVFMLCCSLVACDMPSTKPNTAIQVVRQKSSSTIWERMANDFQLNHHVNHKRVQRFIKQYANRQNKLDLIKYSEQAGPYLYHIVTTLEERDLPRELALLPIIESEYSPFATSPVGAAGIWQLAAPTGRIYGLKQDQWHDGRRDVEAGTAAALSLLEELAKQFNGDWLLALAAYNAGPGRVEQAIRQNKRAGKPTDYWSLSLPQETMYFVPKFLALVHLVQNAKQYNLELAPIPNRPYFTKVQLTKPIELHKAANLAKMEVAELKLLNPACHANTTHPNGPHHILLPIKQAHVFKANYTAQKQNPKPKNPVNKANNKSAKQHTVNKGDTLVIIAAKYQTTVRDIKQKNNLKSDIIRTGQQLAI